MRIFVAEVTGLPRRAIRVPEDCAAMTRRSVAVDSQKVPVTGALIQVARVDVRHSIGRVLLTFDPEHRDDPIFLSWVSGEIARVSAANPVTPNEQIVVEAVR